MLPCQTPLQRLRQVQWLASVLVMLSMSLAGAARAQTPEAAANSKAPLTGQMPSLQQQKDALARDAQTTGAGAASLGKRALEGAKGTISGFGEAFRETRDDFRQRKDKGFLQGPNDKPDDDRVSF